MLFLAFMLLSAIMLVLGFCCRWHPFSSWCAALLVYSFCCWRPCCGWRPYLLLTFMLLLGSCCCWDPFCSWCFTVVGVSSVVGIPFDAGIPAVADVPAVFRINAVVCVSAVILVLLLYPFRKNRKTMVRIYCLIFCIIVFDLLASLHFLHLILFLFGFWLSFFSCETSERIKQSDSPTEFPNL